MAEPVLAEISFASYDPEEIEAALIDGYEAASGRQLGAADPIRVFLKTIASQVIQERFILDDSAQNCMLNYARGDYLEALGDLVGVSRLASQASTCTLEFTLVSAPGVGKSVTISAGTRVAKTGTQIYWATDIDLVISDMNATGTVAATCESAGAATNGYAIGEIDTLVDVVPEVASVENTTESSNGSDEEGDEGLRMRIRLAPTAFSTAGPRDAYEFWARTASAEIADVSVVSPDPGVVDVYVLLAGGELPDAPMLALVEETLSADTVRPLTDTVTAMAPTPVNFSVELTYYINSDDEPQALEIQAAVEQAVADYVAWQISAIGRDVNPSELIERVMAAGAKRVDVTTPVYDAVATTETAALDGEVDLTYGGLEDE